MKLYDDEIERALLGCMLWSNQVIIDIANFIQPECFSVETNRKLFITMIDMNSDKMPVDIVALCSKRCAEPAYIATLTDVVSSSANWEFYARKIKSYYIARELIQSANDVIRKTEQAANSGNIENEIIAIADESAKRITTIADRVGASTKIKMLRDIMPKVCDRLDYAVKHPGELLGLESGLNNLNHYTSGIQNEFIVIGARPSVGKTALGVQIASSMAKGGNKGILFELEMSDEAIALRIVSNESGVNNQLMKSGLIREGRVLDKIMSAMDRAVQWPFAIEDRMNEIHDISARIKYLVRCEGYKWVMIDHISKIRNSNSKAQRHEEYIEISNTLAELSHTLKIPIVALSQLSNDSEGRMPTMKDIPESKAIAQDADTIMFIHRERVGDAASIDTDLIVAKQRDGGVGTAKLVFFPGTTKFADKVDEAHNDH